MQQQRRLTWSDIRCKLLSTESSSSRRKTRNKALQRLAEVVKEQCRSTDLTARYGGDEFRVAPRGVRRRLVYFRGLREKSESVKLEDDGELPPRLRQRGYTVTTEELVLTLFDEAYKKKTWHGPNLRQAIRGVSAKQAAWRPGARRHNIWEETVHAAYWKYAVRRRIEGGKRGSFALQGSNFFPRPEKGRANEAAWRADKELLEREHRALRATLEKILGTPRGAKFLRQIYGVALHDVYHAGQIRLLRRLLSR